MKSGLVVLLGTLILAAATFAFGAEVYVSPSGNDAAAGTLAAPLATIAAARDKADQLKAGNTPVTVYLRGGTYYLSATDTLRAANSGTPSAPITYSAYPGETPLISGGFKVTTPWTTTTANGKTVQVTTLDKNLHVDELFLNGKRQILCRYPNFDSTQIYLDGFVSQNDALAKAGTCANPTEGPGYVRALHQNLWGGTDAIITGKNGSTVTIQWMNDHALGTTPDGVHSLIENIFELLDSPGEWFYRKSTGELFFYPPAGVDLSTAKIELASLDQLIVIQGSSSTAPVHDLRFTGITFAQTHRTLFDQPFTVCGGDWLVVRMGVMRIENAQRIQVDHCLFDQIGGNGIFISGYNRSHVITRNTFVDGGASCVLAMGNSSSVNTGTAAGPKDSLYPSRIVIDNNLMDHFGRFEKQPAGVSFSWTLDDTVLHNEICNCPRAGINCCNGCWGGHEIAYNWVYKTCLESQDHGPYNSWGRDRNWNNSDTSLTEVDAWHTTKLHNNRMESAPPLFGLDLDDGSSNYDQWDNLLIGVGLKLWHGRHNHYHNNILINGGVTEFHDTYDNSGDYFAHQIITGAVIYSFCCFADMSANGLPTEVRQRVPMLDSNCVWSFGVDPKMCQWQQRTTYTTNWTAWRAVGLDAHTQLADPLFVDTAKVFPNGYKPRGDFRVQTGSPAVAIGFKNFPMDSFGIMNDNSASARSPFVGNRALSSEKAFFNVHYNAGTLSIAHNGEYRVTIATALGRIVKVYYGKGNTSFSLSAKSVGPGIYFVDVRAKDGITKQKLLVK